MTLSCTWGPLIYSGICTNSGSARGCGQGDGSIGEPIPLPKSQ